MYDEDIATLTILSYTLFLISFHYKSSITSLESFPPLYINYLQSSQSSQSSSFHHFIPFSLYNLFSTIGNLNGNVRESITMPGCDYSFSYFRISFRVIPLFLRSFIKILIECHFDIILTSF